MFFNKTVENYIFCDILFLTNQQHRKTKMDIALTALNLRKHIDEQIYQLENIARNAKLKASKAETEKEVEEITQLYVEMAQIFLSLKPVEPMVRAQYPHYERLFNYLITFSEQRQKEQFMQSERSLHCTCTFNTLFYVQS